VTNTLVGNGFFILDLLLNIKKRGSFEPSLRIPSTAVTLFLTPVVL